MALTKLEALEKVRDLTKQYARAEAEERQKVMLELQDLASKNENIISAVNKLSVNDNLVGAERQVIQQYQKDILSQTPTPTPTTNTVDNSADRKKLPPPLQYDPPRPTPQDKYVKKLEVFRKDYQNDAKLKAFFDATLSYSANMNSNINENKEAILQWLVGSGPPNFLGATKLGPAWNAIGGILQGDIAGDIKANVLDDNLQNADFADTMGKLSAHMNDIQTTAANAADHNLGQESPIEAMHIEGPFEKALVELDNEINRLESPAPGA